MKTIRRYVNARRALMCLCLVALTVYPRLAGLAQNKTACDLLTQADVEAIFGIPFQAPKPIAPFRSLLDNQDFVSGKISDGCRYTSVTQPPPQVVEFVLDVRFSSAPNPTAVADVKRQVDRRTYDHPSDLPGLGDAAFAFGAPNNMSLVVFHGGTTTFEIGPSGIGLEKEKALALKVLGRLGKTGFSYRLSSPSLAKPVVRKPVAGSSAVDRIKYDLTTKAEAGDAQASLALAQLYEFATLAVDATVKPDYPAAAYWYQQAADHGNPQAAYRLAMLYRDGHGVPANAGFALEFFEKAASAGYVAAMAPLSYAYGTSDSPVRQQRATQWAQKAADAGDPEGWLILGFEYDKGWLGGERSYQYRMAMESYRRAADKGECRAMLNIGGLYFNGSGGPQDAAQAQSWFAKAETCVGQNLDWVRQEAARYRQRAAAGRLPPQVTDVPVSRGRLDLSDGQKLLAGAAALVALAIAADVLNPSSDTADARQPDRDAPLRATIDRNQRALDDAATSRAIDRANHTIGCAHNTSLKSFGGSPCF